MHNSSKTLLILGMHRSGTSLFTNWLHDCGLNVGDNLLGATSSNAKGHFEDLNFLEIHNAILKENKTDWIYRNNKKIVINKQRVEQAKAIIKSNNQKYDQWGFKDPRTCLFLAFWEELLPDANKIVVFRHYRDVTNSLVSRHIRELNRGNNHLRKLMITASGLLGFYNNMYLKTWYSYNKKLLDRLRNDKKVLFINSENFNNYQSNIFTHLSQELGYILEHVDFNSIYDEKLWKKNKKMIMSSYDKNLLNKAEYVWHELNKIEEERFK